MTVKSVPDIGRLLDKQNRLFIYVYIGYSLADVEHSSPIWLSASYTQ